MQFEMEESGKQSSLRYYWGRASDYLFSTELLEVAEDVESPFREWRQLDVTSRVNEFIVLSLTAHAPRSQLYCQLHLRNPSDESN